MAPDQKDTPVTASLNTEPSLNDEIEDIKSDDPDIIKKLKEREEKKNLKKKKINKVEILNDNTEKETLANAKELPNTEKSEVIPTVSTLFALGTFFNDDVTSTGLLHSNTKLQFIGFGARYINEQETVAYPRGMRFSLKVGIPLKKDNYTFPLYRSFEMEIYKRNIFGHFQVLGGLDSTPMYFVNLPNAGEGLQVFENDIYWLKGGLGYNQEIKGKTINLRAIFLLSLAVKNNQKKNINGTSLVYSLNYQHNKSHGAEITMQKSYFVGDLTIEAQSFNISYIYKFEN